MILHKLFSAEQESRSPPPFLALLCRCYVERPPGPRQGTCSCAGRNSVMLVIMEPLHGRAAIRTKWQAPCVLAVPRQSRMGVGSCRLLPQSPASQEKLSSCQEQLREARDPLGEGTALIIPDKLFKSRCGPSIRVDSFVIDLYCQG